MKRIFTLVIVSLLCSSSAIMAQSLKFGHVNMQETIYLMSEMDSARVVLEKYGKNLEEIFVSMQTEYQTKLNAYQQSQATWSPAVLQAKEQELMEIQQRLQQYQQSAEQDLAQKQNQLLTPIYQKANEAIKKVGKANGFTYIFDISAGNIPYFDEAASTDVTPMLKKELNIPLDKKLPVQAPQQAM